MKILIAYDGSERARDAIHDLDRAGLSNDNDVEAIVLSVADVWPPSSRSAAVPVSGPPHTGAPRDLTDEAMAEASAVARQGAEHVRIRFPSWKITAESRGDSPVRALLQRADEWQPDLLVLGSRGRSAIGRIFLGSVALAIVQHAPGSVRIGRRHGKPGREAGAPVRVIVGVDGSRFSATAIQAVAMRKWPPLSEARVITVTDLRLLSTPQSLLTGAGFQALDSTRDILRLTRRAVDRAAEELREAGFSATPVVCEGDPGRALVQNADDWGADCIFVGAQGLTRMERLLLGSVSSAVVTRAHCSVEVVKHG